MSRMSRSLTPSAYSPGKGKKDRRGRGEKENIRRGRKNRQDDLLTFSPRLLLGTAPHDPCPGQQCSRSPALASGLSQAPLLGLWLLMGPQPPAQTLSFIHHLIGLPAVPGPVQGPGADELGPCPPGSLRLRGNAKRCERRLQAKCESVWAHRGEQQSS